MKKENGIDLLAGLVLGIPMVPLALTIASDAWIPVVWLILDAVLFLGYMEMPFYKKRFRDIRRNYWHIAISGILFSLGAFIIVLLVGWYFAVNPPSLFL